MSRSGEFCPRCGDPIERPGSLPAPGGPDSGLCNECYLAAYDLVDAPDRVEVRVCRQCGAIQRGNRWADVGAEDYTDVAIEETTAALGVHVDAASVSWQVKPEQVDETTVRMHCTFSGVLRGTPVTEEATVPVKIGRGTCDRCGRIAGGAYASVVQVRGRDRRPADAERSRAEAIAREVVADLEADGDRDAFVSEVSDRPEGLDLKLSTTKLGDQVARQIATELGGTVSESETLVTEDGDGNEVYRVTYAVRLPPYRPGEVIDPGDGDGPVLVRSLSGSLTGTRVRSGEPYRAPLGEDAPEADSLGFYGDARQTTLVAVEDDHAVQVLDPETYEARTVARPAYLDPDAAEVPVLKSRAGLYVLPEEGPG
jgi:nonsense-mediated mRNA decay protein 3